MSELKLKKSLQRFSERIQNGSFYEAEQTILSISTRYIYSKNYQLAIDLIFNAIVILLDNAKYDMAASLYYKLLEIFEQAKIDQRDQNSKLETILKLFPNGDQNWSTLAKETLKFERNVSDEFQFGKVNEILGLKLLNGGKAEFVNLSEQFLITSPNEEIVSQLVNFELESMKISNDESNFGSYVSRLVLSYLLTNNTKFAQLSLDLMLSQKPSYFPEPTDIKGLKIYETQSDDQFGFNIKLVNYLQLLIECCEKGQQRHFSILFKNYANVIEHFEGLINVVNTLAETKYNFSVIRKQTNPLQMMGNLLGGGK